VLDQATALRPRSPLPRRSPRSSSPHAGTQSSARPGWAPTDDSFPTRNGCHPAIRPWLPHLGSRGYWLDQRPQGGHSGAGRRHGPAHIRPATLSSRFTRTEVT
jgi:hypothetical protein